MQIGCIFKVIHLQKKHDMSNHSVSLKGIGIENFKAFGKYQYFDLAPITIITGPNNSGKSALIAALELLSKSDIFSNLNFHAEGLEIGDLSQVINKSSKIDELIFSLDFKYTKNNAAPFELILYYDNSKARLSKIILVIHNEPRITISLQTPYVCQIDFQFFETLFGFKSNYFRDEEYVKWPQLKEIEPLIRESLSKPQIIDFGLEEGDGSSIDYSAKDESLKIIEHFIWRMTEPDTFLAQRSLSNDDEDYCSREYCMFSDIFEKYTGNQRPLYNPKFLDFLHSVRKNIIKLLSEAREETQNIFKIEAQRASKQRVYLYQEKNNPLTRDIINAAQSDNDRVKDFLKKWTGEKCFNLFDDFQFDPIPGVGYRFQVLKNGDWRELPDLGFGTRQVLPVILGIFNHVSSVSRNMLIIEEPESNLHPKLQSMLADLFVDTRKGSLKPLIIETHSEYLIRKLQYWVAKKEIAPENIAIHYIGENNGKGERDIYEIKIEPDGSLDRDFGTGFFDVATNWRFELMRIKHEQKN